MKRYAGYITSLSKVLWAFEHDKLSTVDFYLRTKREQWPDATFLFLQDRQEGVTHWAMAQGVNRKWQQASVHACEYIGGIISKCRTWYKEALKSSSKVLGTRMFEVSFVCGAVLVKHVYKGTLHEVMLKCFRQYGLHKEYTLDIKDTVTGRVWRRRSLYGGWFIQKSWFKGKKQ